jgi:hypothetical protein
MRSVRQGLFHLCIALSLACGVADAFESPDSFLLRAWPELKGAQAPFWLKEGVRLTYETVSIPVQDADAAWEDAGETPISRDAGDTDTGARTFTEVSVVAVDRTGVAASVRRLDSAKLAGPVRPSAFTAAVGAPGIVGEWWIAPEALASIPDGAANGIVVQRTPCTTRGITYNAIRFLFETPEAKHALLYDLKSGILVYRGTVSETARQTPRSPDLPPLPSHTLARTILVEYREISLPWTYDLPPQWIADFHSTAFEGSFTTILPGAQALPSPIKSTMTVTDRGRRWFRYRLDDATAALQEFPAGFHEGSRVSGIAQVGGLWIPPAGLSRLRKGQIIDTAPLTGARVAVATAEEESVTLREQATGYEIDFVYDCSTGALTRMRFVDRTLNQVVEQRRVR